MKGTSAHNPLPRIAAGEGTAMADLTASDRAPGRFAGKVALVTGGNSGIGRHASLAFAGEGAKVVVAARRVDEGEQTVELIRDAGGEAVFIATDVTRAESVQAMVRACVERYGRLDAAFNNAGVTGSVSDLIVDYDEETFDRTVAVNLKGTWLCMKYEIPEMLRAGRGSIVNCSSTAGLRGGARASGYYASKHAIVGLTKSIALEYAAQAVRINAVCPGMIGTEMVVREFARAPDKLAQLKRKIPMGRIGTVEEIAAAVLWLCADESSYVTGAALSADGGFVI
jgi:NAD(P)-dependent dehydrogenase (short-subunit alcohol dehydrogenase family)